MRFRNISIIIGVAATFLLTFLSDPDIGPNVSMFFGAQTLLAVKSVVTLSLACLVIHLSRKTLFDYLKVHLFFEEAKKSPQGSGLALVATAIFMLAFSIVFGVLVFLL